ncbi:hypothetical protein [Halomonas halophila]
MTLTCTGTRGKLSTPACPLDRLWIIQARRPETTTPARGGRHGRQG